MRRNFLVTWRRAKQKRRFPAWTPGLNAAVCFGRNRKIGKASQMLLSSAYLRVKQLSYEDRKHLSQLFQPVGNSREPLWLRAS
jgi:hypothetical protein